ncbi:MAG: hypothetical protein ACR2OJ_10630 [Hyphomicrobiales bacterium]
MAEKPDGEKKHMFDDPKNVKRVMYALYAACTITFLLDFVVKRYVDHPLEAVIGFYCIYGFAACVALVLVATEMRKFIMRDEDYYDDE